MCGTQLVYKMSRTPKMNMTAMSARFTDFWSEKRPTKRSRTDFSTSFKTQWDLTQRRQRICSQRYVHFERYGCSWRNIAIALTTRESARHWADCRQTGSCSLETC